MNCPLQESGLNLNSAKGKCEQATPFGEASKGSLFAARDEEHMKAVENRRVMNVCIISLFRSLDPNWPISFLNDVS